MVSTLSAVNEPSIYWTFHDWCYQMQLITVAEADADADFNAEVGTRA